MMKKSKFYIRRVSPQILLDAGLLQQINIKVLHPLGLALSVEMSGDNPDKVDKISPSLISTNDPTGFWYSDDDYFSMRKEAYQKFLKKKRKILSRRLMKLGYIEQC